MKIKCWLTKTNYNIRGMTEETVLWFHKPYYNVETGEWYCVKVTDAGMDVPKFTRYVRAGKIRVLYLTDKRRMQ